MQTHFCVDRQRPLTAPFRESGGNVQQTSPAHPPSLGASAHSAPATASPSVLRYIFLPAAYFTGLPCGKLSPPLSFSSLLSSVRPSVLIVEPRWRDSRYELSRAAAVKVLCGGLVDDPLPGCVKQTKM